MNNASITARERPLRCKCLGCRWDDGALEYHGMLLCERCGGEWYDDPGSVRQSIGYLWWRHMTNPYSGLWPRLTKPFRRCEHCHRTRANCDCLPF